MRHPGIFTFVVPGEEVSVGWLRPTQFLASFCYEVSRSGYAIPNIDDVTISFKGTSELKKAQQ